MTPAEMVAEFHRACGLPAATPTLPVLALRARLIREEAQEALAAIAGVARGGREHIAKELADLLYVVYGTGDQLGIDLDEAFRIVHASNMSKLVDGEPVLRADGKVLKGPHFKPPVMDSAVLEVKP